METKIAKSMICLYSKFSPNSTKFLELSKPYNLPLDYICIDNKNIRNRIVKNKKILVQSVPCLLFIYDNGVLEKYEGYNAFEWVNQIIKNIENSKQVIQPQIPIDNNIEIEKEKKVVNTNKVSSKVSSKVSKNPNPPSTPIDLLEEEEEEEEIEDIEDIEEEDLDKNLIKKEDKIEDIEQINNNFQKPMRDIDTSGFNSSKVSGKSGKKDVMSLARELEKQRETEEASGKKNRKNI
jgi:hypothetical protein